MFFKFQSHDPDTPTYIEALSGEHTDEYYKDMDDEIRSLIRRETQEIVPRKSVYGHNFLLRTQSFKYKRKPDWNIRILKAQYCVIVDVQNRLSPEPLNSYYPLVQGTKVMLVLVLQCILGLQIQIICFINIFDQEDIPGGEPVLIELPRDFNSY